MQTLCRDISWMRTLRPIALILALVLSLELTIPVGGYAQLIQNPASIPVASQGNQELPPMQEAETIQERKPFYKRWWFWALVGAAVAGGAAGVAIGSGGGGSTASGPGNVKVQW